MDPSLPGLDPRAALRTTGRPLPHRPRRRPGRPVTSTALPDLPHHLVPGHAQNVALFHVVLERIEALIQLCPLWVSQRDPCGCSAQPVPKALEQVEALRGARGFDPERRLWWAYATPANDPFSRCRRVASDRRSTSRVKRTRPSAVALSRSCSSASLAPPSSCAVRTSTPRRRSPSVMARGT